jgi:hypothetical protein
MLLLPALGLPVKTKYFSHILNTPSDALYLNASCPKFPSYKNFGKQLSLSSPQLYLKVLNERNASWQNEPNKTAKHHNE